MATAIRMVDPTGNPFLAGLESKTGGANHFFRTMANRPEVLERFVPLYGAIMGRGAVERRLKELIYLTCSYENECHYCIAAHEASAPKAGVTPEEMLALKEGLDSGFNPAEQAVIRYVRELTGAAHPGETRADLAAHFNSEQIVEITLVAAMANFTNRFNNGLGVEPEA